MPTHIVDWDRLTDKVDVYSVDEKGNRMEEPDLTARVTARVDHGTDRGRRRCFADMGIDANRLPITCNRTLREYIVVIAVGLVVWAAIIATAVLIVRS